MHPNKIRIVLVDDHAIVRQGMRRIIEEEEDMCVVAEVGDGDSLLELLPHTPCDVVILDLGLPGRSGFDVLKHIRAQGLKTRILVLTLQPEDQYALRVLAAGADGFLTKGRSIDEVICAIRVLAKGERFLTPTLASLALAAPKTKDTHDVLSDREMDILLMVGQGKRPSDIANELNIGRSTVSTHLNRIKKKLGTQSLGDLVQYAVKSGLV